MAKSISDGEMHSLQKQRDKLLRMQEELNAMLAEVNSKLRMKRGVIDEAAENTRLIPEKPKISTGGGRPVRAVILDALQDLNCPAYSRELAQYCKARFGRSITPERFGTLASDEMRGYQSGSRRRAVWLCFCITYDRHERIKRLWARSDWPLEQRIVTPTTGRIQHLKITASLCDLALTLGKAASDSEMLKTIAADHARDLPGIKFQRGKFELKLWRDTALKFIEELQDEDHNLRKESAFRLSQRSDFHQLFGMPDVIDGAEPSQNSGRA